MYIEMWSVYWQSIFIGSNKDTLPINTAHFNVHSYI